MLVYTIMHCNSNTQKGKARLLKYTCKCLSVSELHSAGIWTHNLVHFTELACEATQLAKFNTSQGKAESQASACMYI